MRMRLQAYDIEVIYQSGPMMYIADLLSRSYLPISPNPSSVEFESRNMAQFISISNERLTEIRAETIADITLQLLKETILHGWPNNKHELPSQVRPYCGIRDELSMQDELIFRGERVVVPAKLHRDMKNTIHSSHLGAESCLRRARCVSSDQACQPKYDNLWHSARHVPGSAPANKKRHLCLTRYPPDHARKSAWIFSKTTTTITT